VFVSFNKSLFLYFYAYKCIFSEKGSLGFTRISDRDVKKKV